MNTKSLIPVLKCVTDNFEQIFLIWWRQLSIVTIASVSDVTVLSFVTTLKGSFCGSHTFLFALWARLWFETTPLRYRVSKVMMRDDVRCSWRGIGEKERVAGWLGGGLNLQQRSSDVENCPGALQGADLAFTPDQSSLPHSCKYYLASINTGRGHQEVPTMFDYCRNDGKCSELFVLQVHEKKKKNNRCSHMLIPCSWSWCWSCSFFDYLELANILREMQAASRFLQP